MSLVEKSTLVGAVVLCCIVTFGWCVGNSVLSSVSVEQVNKSCLLAESLFGALAVAGVQLGGGRPAGEQDGGHDHWEKLEKAPWRLHAGPLAK